MTLTERLKAETYDAHMDLEQTPILKRLARGELPRQTYVEILKQLYLVHEKLEGLLESHGDNERIAAVYRPYHPRRERALADIRHFEPHVDVSQLQANAGTARLLEYFDAIAARRPDHLLGAFYVLEGSNFGATFLVKVFQRAYRLEDAGVNYYLGHKHELKLRWDAFKQAMNAIFSEEKDQNEVIEVAQGTFKLIKELYLSIKGEGLSARHASGH